MPALGQSPAQEEQPGLPAPREGQGNDQEAMEPLLVQDRASREDFCNQSGAPAQISRRGNGPGGPDPNLDFPAEPDRQTDRLTDPCSHGHGPAGAAARLRICGAVLALSGAHQGAEPRAQSNPLLTPRLSPWSLCQERLYLIFINFNFNLHVS